MSKKKVRFQQQQQQQLIIKTRSLKFSSLGAEHEIFETLQLSKLKSDLSTLVPLEKSWQIPSMY